MGETTLICYRGACDQAADVRGYNRVTHGLYCMDCAKLIDRSGTAPGGSMYPLLTAFDDLRPAQSGGGAYQEGLIRVRPAQTGEPQDQAAPKGMRTHAPPVAAPESAAIAELRRLLGVAKSDDPYVSLIVKSDLSLCCTTTTVEMERKFLGLVAKYVYREGIRDLRLGSEQLAKRVEAMLLDVGINADEDPEGVIDLIAHTLSTPTEEHP